MLVEGSVSQKSMMITLLVGIVLFAGGVVVAAFQKPNVDAPANTVKSGATITDEVETRASHVLNYESPEFIAWAAPATDNGDSEWRYDVFTPPRIYINPETGNFEPTAYQFEKEVEIPELELISVSRPLFRFQLTGYIENSLTDAEQSILLIEDLESDETKQIRFERGATVGDEYRMLSFEILRRATDAGAIIRSGQLAIANVKGEQMLLTSTELAFLDGYVLEMSYGGNAFTLTNDAPEFADETVSVRFFPTQSNFPEFHFEVFDNATATSLTFNIQSDSSK